MKHSIIKTALIFSTLATGGALHAAGKSMGRAVGAGLTYPSSNQSLTVNPSVLGEASNLSLQGLYGFDSQDAVASLVGASGSLGWGLGWHNSGGGNHIDGGFGFNLGGFMLGFDLATTDFDGLNADAALTFDLGGMRLAAALRGINNGLDRADIGLGFMVSSALISIDLYKALPWGNSDIYGIDTSLAINSGKLGVGVGYDFNYAGGVSDGTIHADLSFAVSQGFALEGHYDLTPRHSAGIGGWSAGARFLF